MKKLCIALALLAFLCQTALARQDWSHLKYDQPVTVTLLLDHTQDVEPFQAVSALMEEHLNIKTEIHLRPTGMQGANYVKSLLAMGEMTDLCVYNVGALVKSLSPQTYFVDLSGESFAQRIEPLFAQAVSLDGALYGIPMSEASVGGWLYNREIHERLNLEKPRTWAQLMDNCQVMLENGVTPIASGYAGGWSSQIILLADYHNLAHESPNFSELYNLSQAGFADTPAALRGFEKLYEIWQKGYTNSDVGDISYEDACRLFAQGGCGYMPALSNALPTIERAAPGFIDDIGLFGQPGDRADYQGITYWLPQGIYLSNTSKNIEAAKRWMAFFLSDDGLNAFGQYRKATGPFSVKDTPLSGQTYACLEEIKFHFEQGTAVPALEFSSPFKSEHLIQITQECALGIIPPLQAAQQYDQDVKRQALLLGMLGGGGGI